MARGAGKAAVHFRPCWPGLHGRPASPHPGPLLRNESPSARRWVTQWSGQPARGRHRLSQQQGARGWGGSARGEVGRPGKQPAPPDNPSQAGRPGAHTGLQPQMPARGTLLAATELQQPGGTPEGEATAGRVHEAPWLGPETPVP